MGARNFLARSQSLAAIGKQKRRFLQVRPAWNAGPGAEAFQYEERTPFRGPVLFFQ